MSIELTARLSASPKMQNELEKLNPKMLALSSDTSATPVKMQEVDLEEHLAGARLRIEAATFTGAGDKLKVVGLHKTYVEQIASVMQKTLHTDRRESLQLHDHSAQLQVPELDMPPAPPVHFAPGQLLLVPCADGKGAEAGMIEAGQTVIPLTVTPLAGGDEAAQKLSSSEYSHAVLPWRPPVTGWRASLLRVATSCMEVLSEHFEKVQDQIMAWEIERLQELEECAAEQIERKELQREANVRLRKRLKPESHAGVSYWRETIGRSTVETLLLNLVQEQPDQLNLDEEIKELKSRFENINDSMEQQIKAAFIVGLNWDRLDQQPTGATELEDEQLRKALAGGKQSFETNEVNHSSWIELAHSNWSDEQWGLWIRTLDVVTIEWDVVIEAGGVWYAPAAATLNRDLLQKALLAAMQALHAATMATLMRTSGAVGSCRYFSNQMLTVQRHGGTWTDAEVVAESLDEGTHQLRGERDEFALTLHPWNHACRELPLAAFEELREWWVSSMRSQHSHIVEPLTERRLDVLEQCVAIDVHLSGNSSTRMNGVLSDHLHDAAGLSRMLHMLYAKRCEGGAVDVPGCVLLTAGPAAGKSCLMSQVIMHVSSHNAMVPSEHRIRTPRPAVSKAYALLCVALSQSWLKSNICSFSCRKSPKLPRSLSRNCPLSLTSCKPCTKLGTPHSTES